MTGPSAASSDVADRSEHARVEVIEQMAVHRPPPRIFGVERHDHPTSGGDQNRIAHRSPEALAVDLHHLKLMPVQMHRMGHWRLVDENKLDTLALGHGE